MKNSEQTIEEAASPESMSHGTGHSKAANDLAAAMPALERLIAHGEALLKDAVNYSAEGLAAARDRLAANLEQAKIGVEEVRSVIKMKSSRIAGATERYVIANPWRALLVAGSVGLVVGLLLRRRR